jgi:hypothetical protein
MGFTGLLRRGLAIELSAVMATDSLLGVAGDHGRGVIASRPLSSSCRGVESGVEEKMILA